MTLPPVGRAGGRVLALLPREPCWSVTPQRGGTGSKGATGRQTCHGGATSATIGRSKLYRLNAHFLQTEFVCRYTRFFYPKDGERKGKHAFSLTHGTCQIIRQTHPRRVSGEYAE